MSRVYDVIILGGGPVGINAADRAHAEGLSVALVERELVGGECNFWGCVPSKSLLRPVLAVAEARKVDGAREAMEKVDPSLVDAPLIFPDDEFLAQAFSFMSLDEAKAKEYDRDFSQAIG